MNDQVSDQMKGLFKKSLTVILLSLWMVTGFGNPVHGGFISLNTQAKIQYSEGRLQIEAEISNHGDESAHNIQIIGNVSGKVFSSEVKNELGVEEQWKQVLTHDLELDKPGNYPVLLMIRYTDANQYPFSALSVPNLVYQEGTSSKVLGVLKGMELSSKGSTKVEVKNLDSEPKKIRLTFFVPEELSTTKEGESIELKPRGETVIPLTIKNFSALPGSTYPVFAILEYDLGDKHYSSTATGTVKIVKKDIIVENKTVLMVVGGLLVIFLVVLNLRARRRRSG